MHTKTPIPYFELEKLTFPLLIKYRKLHGFCLNSKKRTENRELKEPSWKHNLLLAKYSQKNHMPDYPPNGEHLLHRKLD